jgi:hypothetical protein
MARILPEDRAKERRSAESTDTHRTFLADRAEVGPSVWAVEKDVKSIAIVHPKVDVESSVNLRVGDGISPKQTNPKIMPTRL